MWPRPADPSPISAEDARIRLSPRRGEERRGPAAGASARGCWCVRSRPEDGRVGDAAPTPGEGEDGGSPISAEDAGIPRRARDRFCLSPRRDLCITRQVVARKTPHRFRPKTPESASPPGEGKEWRLLEGIDTAHPPAKTAAASPRGEARDCVPEDGGYAKVSSERGKTGIPADPFSAHTVALLARGGKTTDHSGEWSLIKVTHYQAARGPGVVWGCSQGCLAQGTGWGRGEHLFTRRRQSVHAGPECVHFFCECVQFSPKCVHPGSGPSTPPGYGCAQGRGVWGVGLAGFREGRGAIRAA